MARIVLYLFRSIADELVFRTCRRCCPESCGFCAKRTGSTSKCTGCATKACYKSFVRVSAYASPTHAEQDVQLNELHHTPRSWLRRLTKARARLAERCRGRSKASTGCSCIFKATRRGCLPKHSRCPKATRSAWELIKISKRMQKRVLQLS